MNDVFVLRGEFMMRGFLHKHVINMLFTCVAVFICNKSLSNILASVTKLSWWISTLPSVINIVDHIFSGSFLVLPP